MKKSFNKKFGIFGTTLLVCNVGLLGFAATSCGESNFIQFANFESYMSENLKNDLYKKYKIEFTYYTTAENIETKFEKYYDTAVPCGYELLALLRRGWLHKIDWAKFQIPGINNAYDALHNHLFHEEGLVIMNNQFTNYINSDSGSDLKKYLDADGTFNILNYGVPYFAQSFLFAYKGNKINFYKNQTAEITNSPTWSDIFYTISPSNANCDQRFKPTNRTHLNMIDDAKSLYDVSRIIESIENNEEPTNEITKDDSKNRMIQTYNHMTDKFSNKKGSWFNLNTDSGIISRNVADPNGAPGALTWSGDTIYAAQGAEEFPCYNKDNFHVIKPAGGSLDEIEFVVMNNKNEKPGAENRLNDVYKIVKQVCLDGADKTEEEIVQFNQIENRYQYWTVDNFNTVNYSPMLNNLFKAVINKDSQYWVQEEYDPGTVELFINILNIDYSDAKHLFGRTLTSGQNSNNHWAWLESRGKL